MILPEPQTKTYSAIVEQINNGGIKIPQFQRDFVWGIQKSAALIDSIIKGYPIGSFIFWRTNERLRSVRDIGGCSLPEPKAGEMVDYVLDGQQRLTSLYACLKGVEVKRASTGKTDDFAQIYINLGADSHEKIVTTERDEENRASFIRIVDLLAGDFTVLAKYDQKYHEKLKQYQNSIKSYQYSVIQVMDAPIDVATEIFTRINVGGRPLSLFEVMVAKTFDHERNFDLSEKYEGLIDHLGRPGVNYDTISDATVLQVVSMILTRECKRQSILNLDKLSFIDAWPHAVDAIERAVDYFRGYFRIPVSQLLPYNALVVPFAYFFYKQKDAPAEQQERYLVDFFWRCSLSARYSSSVEGKLAQDIKRIDLILEDKLPSYDWAIDSSAAFIMANGDFRTGRSYIKAILCLYAYHQPKSFSNDAIVNIDNNWLKQANSKNYHHFFPRAYLTKQGEDERYINHILNITFVDDYLNKRVIRDKAPSTYMKQFKRTNKDLAATMQTHLIGDLGEFGVWEDDYDAFLEKRATAVCAEIKERIIEQEIDKKGQQPLENDYEEDTTSAE